MKERLSYQRLLEVTAKLSDEDRIYVLRFVTNNNRKTIAYREMVEKELRDTAKTRQHYLDLARDVERERTRADNLRKDRDNLQVRNTKLCEQVKSLGRLGKERLNAVRSLLESSKSTQHVTNEVVHLTRALETLLDVLDNPPTVHRVDEPLEETVCDERTPA